MRKASAGQALKVRDKLIQQAFNAPEAALVVTDMSRQELEAEYAALEGAVIEEKRELSKLSFWYFITNVMFPANWRDHYSPDFHQNLCQIIQDLLPGEDFWAIVPREARKSYILTILMSWWRIVCDPEIRLLLVGAREETVKPFARLILSAFLPGTPGFEEFHRIFPDYVIHATGRHVKQAFQFTHPLRRKALADPTFRAAYLGVTGAGWRCDELHFDDPIERRNVTTPDQAAKGLRNMLDLLPLIDTGSRYRHIIGAGTRWSYMDPYGRIIGEKIDDEEAASVVDAGEALRQRKTRVMVRHALENPRVPCSRCPAHVMKEFPHGEFDLEDGLPITSPVHTKQMILDRYEEYSLDPDRGESLFYHQYGNICLAPKDQKFQDEWIVVAPYPYFPTVKRRVLCIDAADKDFAMDGGGDYMVALFGEFDDFGRLLLVHGIRSNKWTRKTFIERMLTWCHSTGWWPDIVVKEKFGDSGSFLTDLKDAFTEHFKTPRIKAVTRPGGSSKAFMAKMDWIVASLQAPMENGDVVFGSAFPKPIRERGREELVKLGQMRKDDVADTMALFMTEGVRLVATKPRHAERLGVPAPPDLQLYNAPASRMPGEAPPTDPLQTAVDRLQNSSVILELPEVTTERWTPPPIGIKLDL